MACSYGEDKKVLHRRSNVNKIRKERQLPNETLDKFSAELKEPSQRAEIYSAFDFLWDKTGVISSDSPGNKNIVNKFLKFVAALKWWTKTKISSLITVNSFLI